MNPQIIKITNFKAIDGSITTYVRFMVDMTYVPVGYTVENTVGGNTTKTTKYDGGLILTAKKQIDGKIDDVPAGKFSFQLMLTDGSILQTKTNDASGSIAFDRITYTIDDVGKTYMYRIKEEGNATDPDYTYDTSEYTVTVTPALEKDSSGNPTGKILADPGIYKGNGTDEADRVTEIVFNNTKKEPTPNPKPDTQEGNLVLSKSSFGHETPAEAAFTIKGPDFSKTVKYSELEAGKATFSNIPVGIYSVEENNAGVEGYTVTVDGNKTAEVKKDTTAELALTNTYTHEENSTKHPAGGSGGSSEGHIGGSSGGHGGGSSNVTDFKAVQFGETTVAQESETVEETAPSTGDVEAVERADSGVLGDRRSQKQRVATPDTGDESYMVFYLTAVILAVLALAADLAMLAKHRRKH